MLDDVPSIAAFEVFLRVIALVTLTSASLFMWLSLLRGRLRPRVVWLHVAVVASLTATWRVMVLVFVFNEPLHEVLRPWITPITAATWVLGGISLLLLAYVSTRRRGEDG